MEEIERISGEERAKRRKAVANAAASMRLEGFNTPPAAQAVNDRYIDGEIDAHEQERQILILAGCIVPDPAKPA